jgi:hypothetical protein
MIFEPPDLLSPDPYSLQGYYANLAFASALTTFALLILVTAWRYFIRWLAEARGAVVTPSAEGLTVRDQMTRWRPRFIPWNAVVSLAGFTYTNPEARAGTIYLLDAGDQTFLWESLPEIRYESPIRLAHEATQRLNAAQLMRLVVRATGQPLLNISGVMIAVVKLSINPKRGAPDPKDAELFDFIEGQATFTEP